MSAATIVVFRVWPKKEGGGVIALFPQIDEGHGMCSSFMHVGQHSGASASQVVAATRPAKPEEYAALKRELESAPYEYRLDVRARLPRRSR